MGQDAVIVAENVQVVSPRGISGGMAPASISVATAVSTTIPLAARIIKVSCSAVTTSGSCTLANGTLDGQEVILINESANNVIISGGMMGSSAQTCAANSGKKFIWSATDTAWFGA